MAENASDILFQTIAKIRKSILKLKDRGKKIGEENTKTSLINPILTALGWNVGDLDEVCMEYRRKPKDNPVDYALFLLRKECLFIEAKALEHDINDDKWILQILSYATAAGVEWCVLTNGNEYRLYNAHAPVPADEKLFRRFRISESSENGFALETLQLISKEKISERALDVLWRMHFIDSRVKNALRSILSPRNASLIRMIQKKTTGISPKDIRESLKRADVQIEFPAMPVESRKAPTKKRAVRATAASGTPTLADLIQNGVIKPPFPLEAEYKGEQFRRISR